MTRVRCLFYRALTVTVSVALALSLTIAPARDAQALTIIIDYTTTSTDIFGQQTGAFNAAPYTGFGATSAQIQTASLAATIHHYLQYPTVGADPNSPLPNSMALNINFVNGTFGTAPTNGDPEFYFIKVGTGLAGPGPTPNATNPNIFGAACLSCVRNAAGAGPNFGVANGAIVGSIWTDHIASIVGLALNNMQIINLIAGTISHEIGHILSLAHLGAQAANPGASAWGVMGSGATGMPNSQRVLQREFTYAKFGQLIGAVGLRDVATVPEPSTLALLGIGLLLMVAVTRRRTAG